jgi:mono/diheme cytochrome c family protein
MISARMSRPVRVLLLTSSVAASVLAAACGTQRIKVPQNQAALHQGAVLFNQRCAGCHTLSYAATRGSAVNIRTAQANNGPNFDTRCERPLSRVVYAIENGGFSGAIMPQNVVVGQDAMNVANFVATYSGRQAPPIPGVQPCTSKPVGTVPSVATAASTTTTQATSGKVATTPAAAQPSKKKAGAAQTAKSTQGSTKIPQP